MTNRFVDDFEPEMDDRDWDDREPVDYDEDHPDPRFKCHGSALRAASASNPRNLPCPNCGAEDTLTPEDRALGYQCDRCADKAERGYD